jgi:riboflavin kinase/FMN adenylyltransferase
MELAKTAVALGLFDGVHLGHRAVLAEACAQRKKHLIPAVYTFEPESAVYKPDSSAGFIYGTEAKRKLMVECGISGVIFADFGAVRKLSGEEFAWKVLRERVNAMFVCCGRDFRFGRDASCGAEELKAFGKKYGFEVQVVEDVLFGDSIVSSREIRRMLTEGDIKGANTLLGKPYTVSGKVVDGSHIGHTIGFPTVNQLFGRGQLVPAYGVYSGTVCVDGENYRTVTNIGVKPTIAGERSPLAETHILGYSGDLYGRELDVELNGLIRSERRFASLDELKAQISEDVKFAGNDI